MYLLFRVEDVTQDRPGTPCGHNLAIRSARRYSLMTPPTTRRRSTGYLDRDDNARVVVGKVLIEALMWTVYIEMSLALTEHDTGVFRPRRPWRSLDHIDALGREHGVEGPAKLRVPVSDQETKRRGSLTQVHHHVTGLLGDPSCGRMGGHAEDAYPPSRDVHDAQHVQPTQHHRIEVEKVGHEQPERLRPQKRPPVRINVAWRRTDPADGEDTADGSGTNPVAKPDQFPLDPAMTPIWTLPYAASRAVRRSRSTAPHGRPTTPGTPSGPYALTVGSRAGRRFLGRRWSVPVTAGPSLGRRMTTNVD
jgi:hypothetical protein